MSLEIVWATFLNQLENNVNILSVTKRNFTNLPFLYIQTNVSQRVLEQTIKTIAMNVMRGKRLSLELAYVRKSNDTYVYRLRFLVPNEKMFCCGNGCIDCIRFRT